jgi:hypothetical protein
MNGNFLGIGMDQVDYCATDAAADAATDAATDDVNDDVIDDVTRVLTAPTRGARTLCNTLRRRPTPACRWTRRSPTGFSSRTGSSPPSATATGATLRLASSPRTCWWGRATRGRSSSRPGLLFAGDGDGDSWCLLGCSLALSLSRSLAPPAPPSPRRPW